MKRCRKHRRCRRRHCGDALSIEDLERRTLFSTTLGNGTVVITLPGPPQPPTTAPPLYGMTSLRGNLLYVNNDGVHGSELYRSDGTQAGTTLVKDINTGPASSAIGAAARGYNYLNDTPCIFRNVAYFGANDGVHGVELWRSDGTAAGTYIVRDIAAGSVTYNGSSAPNSSFPGQFTVVGNMLFFVCTNTSGTPELWRTDGTSAGTYRLSDIIPFNSTFYTDPQGPPFAVIGGNLYYRRDVAGSSELWKSDGTLAGTVRVASDPLLEGTDLYASDNQIFLLDRPHDRLFTYVPGSAGIAFVLDIPMPIDSKPIYKDVTALGGKILFVAEYPGIFGSSHSVAQLWVSDGTAAGSRSLVGDTFYDSELNPFGAPVIVGGTAYFGERLTLWKTGGTVGGTQAVKTFAPSGPYNLFPFRGELYFVQGDQLWKSDGTAAGTVGVAALGDQAYGSTFTPVGNRLFLTSADPVRDLEIATLDVDVPGAAPQRLRGLIPHVDYSPRKHRLYLTGSQYNDHLTVAANAKRGRLTVNWNGLTSIFQLADVRSVILTGGIGNDVLTLAGPVPGGTLKGGDGNDVLTGGDLGDLLKGDAGADHLLGGAGDDKLQGGNDQMGQYDDFYSDYAGDTLDGGLGADLLSGGDGYRDVADYSTRTAGVTVSTDGRAHDGAPGEGDDVLDDCESIQGGAGDDYLVGAAGDRHAFYGNAGNDTLVGDGDALYGGAGDDLLTGARRSTNSNWYDGGAGRDTLMGTSFNDEFVAIDGDIDRIFGNGGEDTAHVDRRRRDKLDSIKTILLT